MLRLFGVEPRAFAALVRAFLLMDLRGQHFAAATASKAMYALSPLFIVVGQLLASSALLTAMLYARVEVWFFSFAHLSLGMLSLLTAFIVEFQEAALNPDDLAVLGPRPVPPRTYAAARLANLLFYFALMFLAVTVIPAVAGASLRDAGWWFAPAFALASLAGGLAAMAAVVLLLSALEQGETLRTLKVVLSWSQIVLLGSVFFGGQAVLRAGGFPAVQAWGAFPPAWAERLPPAWLARFVEEASCEPTPVTAAKALGMAGVAAASCLLVGLRLSSLYRAIRPVEQAAGAARPMASPGGLSGGWLTSGPEERAGYWLGLTFLRRDPGLTVRCLFAFQLALAVGVVGIATGQFANPMRDDDPSRTGLTLLALFLVPLAAPNLVFNLSYCRDSAGGWLLRSAPVARPAALARGACKAVFAWVVTPLCVALGLAAGWAWGDPLSAALHAALTWGLTWVFVLASLWLISPALPFSLPPARGGALALPPLPTFALGTVAAAVALIHAKAAVYPAYWVAAFAVLPLVGWLVSRRAERRLARLGGAA
ncbi:MAG: hypothetical protein ACRC33_26260 [Gemmataceae bacterium]